jgi:hypothetical protein
MEATTTMIGEYVTDCLHDQNKYHKRVGGAIVGRLRKRDLIYKITELDAWRMTSAGRLLLSELGKPDEA